MQERQDQQHNKLTVCSRAAHRASYGAGLDFLEHLVEGPEQRAQHLEVMAAEGIFAVLVWAPFSGLQ